MRMTVEERDQWECLRADWSDLYDFGISYQEADEKPLMATPRADPETHLRAAIPRLLRGLVSEDHARRTASASPQEAR